MFDRGVIREGMVVHGADGSRIGKVQSRSATAFVVDRGGAARTDWLCRYEDVAAVDGEEVRLRVTRDELDHRWAGSEDVVGRRPAGEGSDPTWAASEFGGLGVDRADRARVKGDPANQLDPGLGDRKRHDPGDE